ncbi:MAG: response regulator [Caulobacterales bacterium]|nr:response regulator [Caulobacterales bacterium]
MNRFPIGFAQLYASALEAHLRQSGEPALHQAYELGRQAMSEGVGVLDLAQLHHEALAGLMLDRALDDEEGDWLALAAEFLAECLSPFEMMLRGYREANGRLSVANTELMRAHEQLKSEMDERRRAEEALVHAKKLQAVGLLAGGVAHHFNNLLTVILGNLELARRRMTPDERVDRLLLSARRGAERGAEVTRQLLSFSRQQMLQPRKVDPAAWLADIQGLLASTLRGDIVVETEVEPDVAAIEVDPAQLELALLNLAVNARDAMPAGGTLRICARNRQVEDGRLGLHGPYVVIEVADTGEGVPPEILPQVFEPFFSTKGGGPGAGLGLSQVHGFTHQSGGGVEMENRPEGGVVVRLFLPAATHSVSEAAQSLAAAAPDDGSGRVLVVEDDPDLAHLAQDLVESFGYSVAVAHRAQAALDLITAGESIDLLFSDVIMPGGMNGVELAEEVRRRYPRLPVLLTSGYNEAVRDIDAKGLPFIAKPYRRDELRARIEQLLRGER